MSIRRRRAEREPGREEDVDCDGYPDDDELEKIKSWDWHDIKGLCDFVASLWHWPDFWVRRGLRIEAHTGGWSGNESIMDALMENQMFWTICWQSSARGGHYVFQLPAKSFYAPQAAPP